MIPTKAINLLIELWPMLALFLIVLITFLTSALLTPLVKKIAFHVGAVDKPDNVTFSVFES